MSRKTFRLEIDHEAYTRDEAKRRWGLESLKITPKGDTGWPDVIFWVTGGRPVLIEFKRPGAKEEKRSKRQVYIHTFLTGIGYDVQTFDTSDDALRHLGEAVQTAQASDQGNQVRDRTRVRRDLR